MSKPELFMFLSWTSNLPEFKQSKQTWTLPFGSLMMPVPLHFWHFSSFGWGR